jgi:hypothetical protein
MSLGRAALRSHGRASDGPDQSTGSDAGHEIGTASRPAARLSLVAPVDINDKPVVRPPRRRRRIVTVVAVVAVAGMITGLTVLLDGTQAPPATQEPQPTEPAEDAQRQPIAPETTVPKGPKLHDEPRAKDDPRTPVATPTPDVPKPTSSRTADSRPPSGGANPGPGSGSKTVAPPRTQMPADPSPPPTTPPATTPPPITADGVVQGCNTYGEHCAATPLYAKVPPPDYNYRSWPTVTTVTNGTTLTARCWARGGVTFNYAAWLDPPDYGPNPYESPIYFSVRVSGGQWAYIPDAYFVRDKSGRMGLPEC